MPVKYLMDSHKLWWHLDRVRAWTKAERIAPLHIELSLTTGCNLVCTYCYGRVMGQVPEDKRFDLPRHSVMRLLKEVKEIGVRSVALIGEGENPLNSCFYEALDYAQEINLDMSLATNGTILKKDKIKGMLEALTWMRFHISAATPKTYQAIHGRDEFKPVIENIKACVEIKKRHGLATTIGMQMVLLVENKADIIPLVELGKKLGVDYLVIKPCSDTHDKRFKVPGEEYLNMQETFKKAEKCSFKDYAVIIKWDKLSNRGISGYKVCRGTQFIIAINGKGDVAPCGHLFAHRKEEFNMGNIIKQSLKDIILSERYWQVQEKVQTLDINSECESNCLHYYINNFLEKLSHPPPHVNFI